MLYYFKVDLNVTGGVPRQNRSGRVSSRELGASHINDCSAAAIKFSEPQA